MPTEANSTDYFWKAGEMNYVKYHREVKMRTEN